MTLRIALLLLLAGLFAIAPPPKLGDGPGGVAWADDDDDGGSDDDGDDGDDGDSGGRDDDDDDGGSSAGSGSRDDGGSSAGAGSRDDDDDDGGSGASSGSRDDDDDDGSSARDEDDDDDGGGSSARNDDDDDDGGSSARNNDDDDDDDDGGTSPGAGVGNIFERIFGGPSRDEPDRREPVRRAAPSASPAPPPPPVSEPDELVALALSAADLSTLTTQGYQVIEELAVPGLTATPRRLRIPAGTTLADARAAVRALPSGQDADFNHFYRSEGFPEDCEALECPIRRMVDWPEPPDRASGCGGGVPIGMIDTGINDGHETFDGADLEVLRLVPEDFTPSRALHGTAIASLLVGDPATRAEGLLPAARLVAVDAFHRRGSDERADVFTLVEALGLLAERDVGVINLSLAGPPNSVLEEVVTRLHEENDIVLVAAVGNDGPRADPAYPAAYPQVIAVTAVDRDRAVYRRAIQGEHVDLAAPGVAVWAAASISGARWKTGTSYAVPFVTSAAAILREKRPDLTAPEIGAELRRLATDLGDAGPDPVFGAGLVGLGDLCDAPTSSEVQAGATRASP